MLDIVKYRGYFLGFSAVLIVASIVALVYPGLKLGVDFTSGSSITLEFAESDPGTAAVREAFTAAGRPEAVIQHAGGTQYIARTAELGEEGQAAVQTALESKFGRDSFTILEVQTVGATVAAETIRTAFIAVLVGSLFIMLYVFYAFRTVPLAHRYAVAAIVPMFHDVIVTLGIFAVLGRLINVEVSAIFVIGILTIIGSIVNNTIVVFDRIRENVRLAPGRPFPQTVNLAVNETLPRNLNSTITTMIAVLAMLLLGGATLRDFMVLLLTGLAVGLYTSVFFSSQLLIAWETGALGRFFLFWRRRRKAQPQQA